MECPFCDVEYLEGAEICDGCGQDLTAVGETSTRQGRLASTVFGYLADVPQNEPLVLDSKASVADAVALMRERRHGSVQIVDDGELVGIFTESDLLRRVDPSTDLEEAAVADVMTSEPESYTAKDTLAHAINGMAMRGYRHVPIRDEDGHLSGFLSVRSLLAHICDQVGL
jgi:CBS domain-containing protein